MRILYFIFILLICSFHISKADECFKLKGEISSKSKNLYSLKTALEANSPEFRKCQDQVNDKYKDSNKYLKEGVTFPLVVETNKGQSIASCNCFEVIYGSADSVDKIKYRYEMSDCYSKVISKIKLPLGVSLSKICWDGKFPIGSRNELQEASDAIANKNTEGFKLMKPRPINDVTR